jgi:tetratricopeptide (TPR) repeat protein
VILHYLRLSVWPHPLCFDYFGWPLATTWTSVLAPALVMAILLGATAWAWKTNSAWGILGAWFFLILAPSSSFIPLDSPAYEHRMYLALAAVVVPAVMGIYTLLGRRSLVVFLAVAVGLGFLTERRNEDYRTALSIWADTVAKRPNNPRAHNNLGETLSLAGRFGDAIGQFQQAVQLDPQYAVAFNNWGNALTHVGQVPAAITQYQQALRIKPEFAGVHNNLADALMRLGRQQEAMEHYQQALRIEPNSAEVHFNLGVALSQIGRIQDAVGQYVQALRNKPDFAEAHRNLALALEQTHRVWQAIGQYELALRIKPDQPEVQNNLAWLLATLEPSEGGDPVRALPLAARACELTGNRVPAYLDTLAAAYAAVGRFTDAVATAQLAIEWANAANQPQTVKQIEPRLELYRNGQAYHQAAAVTTPSKP